MKVTINKLASKRLLEAFAKVGACRTEEQAEARMSKLLGVPVHVIFTEIDMRAATGEGSVEGSVPLYKLAALVKDALPTLAVGVVTYNNHMQPSIN